MEERRDKVERKLFVVEDINDGSDNAVKVVWELWVNDTMSHTYEQFYNKLSFFQFQTDVGFSQAALYENKFEKE